MTTRPTPIVNSCGLIFCSIITFSALNAAELVLQKVPPLTVEQAPAYPENIARYHFGAEVAVAPQRSAGANLLLSSKTEDANTSEAALLCDDPTVGYALANGSTSLLVSLSRIENIDTISFLNRGAKGTVSIATSNAKLSIDSPEWRGVSQQNLTPDSVKAKIGPGEAKYVKLTFNVTEPGRIAGLGVYSPPTIAAFTMPRSRKLVARDHSDSFALISSNLTDVHAKARALYVTSGDDLTQANSMIDNQPATAYAFAPSDNTPAAIIDLGKVTTLRRISVLCSSRRGNVDFFVLRSLPAFHTAKAKTPTAENAPKTLRIEDAQLAGMIPVGSVVDGNGRAAVDFPETAGRYILLRWSSTGQQDTPFSVAEIAAFGGNKQGSLLAANTVGDNERQVESDGKTVQDAKDLGDSKDIPSEGAETPAEGPPPGLPDPPPFTFVPEIVPTSP